MDHARFTALAEAYGGRIARWPEAERPAAAAIANRPEAARVLALQQELDYALDTYAASPATADLQRRIVTGAHAQRRSRGWLRHWRWPMIGASGALASGMAAGVLFIVATAGPPGESGAERFSSAYAQSSFGDLGLEPAGAQRSDS